MGSERVDNNSEIKSKIADSAAPVGEMESERFETKQHPSLEKSEIKSEIDDSVIPVEELVKERFEKHPLEKSYKDVQKMFNSIRLSLEEVEQVVNIGDSQLESVNKEGGSQFKSKKEYIPLSLDQVLLRTDVKVTNASNAPILKWKII